MARVEELEQARRRLEDFAGLVAHELVKPLIVAESCASGLLAEGDIAGTAWRGDLEDVATACSSARRLVGALLADARQREAVMHREPVDLMQVVRDCVARLAPEIARRHRRVEVDPLPIVDGNAVLLGVVFRNLVANAIEHGFGPDRVVRVFAESSDREWTFAVDSPGPPIPEDRRRQMFEAVRSRGSGGARLGLVIVRRIVERHGGTVGVLAPNCYTNRFFFTLPSSTGTDPAALRNR